MKLRSQTRCKCMSRRRRQEDPVQPDSSKKITESMTGKYATKPQSRTNRKKAKTRELTSKRTSPVAATPETLTSARMQSSKSPTIGNRDASTVTTTTKEQQRQCMQTKPISRTIALVTTISTVTHIAAALTTKR